jgi:hypothetical protein
VKSYKDDNHVARDYIAKNCVLLWKYYSDKQETHTGELGLKDFTFYCKYIAPNTYSKNDDGVSGIDISINYGYFKSGVINRITREWRFSYDHTSLVSSLMASEKYLLELIDEQGLRLLKEGV